MSHVGGLLRPISHVRETLLWPEGQLLGVLAVDGRFPDLWPWFGRSV